VYLFRKIFARGMLMKNKLYSKNPSSMDFYTEAFDGRLSLSAAGIYGMFFCYPILSIEQIQTFAKDSKEDTSLYFQELIDAGLVQEVEDEK